MEEDKMKMMVEVDADSLDVVFRDELRQAYIDQVTIWKAQPDAKELAAALLEVVKYYSAPTEFEEWFETVKDL
jgi:hypothetical protein